MRGKSGISKRNGKISAFFVAPVKRGYYVAGYVIAAIIVSFIMCLLTLIIGVIYLGIANGSFITAHDTLEILFALLQLFFPLLPLSFYALLLFIPIVHSMV